jgi:RNA polymerase sigma-70 factor (ECF subfamily)
MAVNNYATLDDKALFVMVKEGEERAFAEIVNRHQSNLQGFVFKFVYDANATADIVQETFLRVYKNRDKAGTIDYFSTWTYTIASNLARTYLRTQKRWDMYSMDDDDNFLQFEGHNPMPDEGVERQSIEREIYNAIELLPDDFRETAYLWALGFDYKMMAEEMGCPEGTVKSRLNRAKLRLQQTLNNLYNDL